MNFNNILMIVPAWLNRQGARFYRWLDQHVAGTMTWVHAALIMNAGLLFIGLLIAAFAYSGVPNLGMLRFGHAVISGAGAIATLAWLIVYLRLTVLVEGARIGNIVATGLVKEFSRPLPSSPVVIPTLITSEDASKTLRQIALVFAWIACFSACCALFPVYTSLTAFFGAMIASLLLGLTTFVYSHTPKWSKWTLYSVGATLLIFSVLTMIFPGSALVISTKNLYWQKTIAVQALAREKIESERLTQKTEVINEVAEIEQRRLSGKPQDTDTARIIELRQKMAILNSPVPDVNEALVNGATTGQDSSLKLPSFSPEVNRMLFRPLPYYAWGLTIVAFIVAVTLLNTSKNAVIKTAAGMLWIAAVAYGYFIAIPASNWTPIDRQLDSIHAEYREATTLHGQEMRQVADPVVSGFTKQGGGIVTDPAALRTSLFDQARKAHQFDTDMAELEATAKGINIGDFAVDAQIPTFVDVGKKVCRGQWLEAWGEMDPRPGNDNYAHHIEAIGQDPLTNAYDGFQKLVERAPIGALVVSFGNRYQFDWQPMGQGHYMLTPNVEGCQYIKAVVNGWIRGTEPTFRNFHGQHTGGFSVRIHQD